MKAIADAVASDAHSIHIGEPHLTHEVPDAMVETRQQDRPLDG